MLPLYLTCLLVGGVFVGLSALGAIGKDIEAASEGQLELDGDVDLDADADGDVGHAGTPISVGDASQALARNPGGRRVWLPMLSFRFWTYGAGFFGLTGTLLTTLTGAGAVVVAATAGTIGVGVGTLSAWMVRWLRRPVGASVRLAAYTGSVGELLLPLRAGGVTKIRLRVQERERTMLAVATEPLALPTGTRVLVLGIDDSGRAQIEPESTIYNTEE